MPEFAVRALQGEYVQLVEVRCPHCNRLAAEAAAGSRLRVKCVRCGSFFEFLSRPSETPHMPDNDEVETR